MNIAIIPARGGSKRIPRKNIKEFCGKPIIAYSIEVALQSGLFSEVMVSTEDPEIAEIACKYGASIPFLRSTENADDFTGTGDVVSEVLSIYEKRFNREFNIGCCIYATAAFITTVSLKRGFNTLKKTKLDAVISIAKYNSSIWRSFKLTQEGLQRNFPRFETTRSQDIEDAYYDAAQFYWFKMNKFHALKNKNTFGEKIGGVILNDWEVVDIDTKEDWRNAEIKKNIIERFKESET